MIHYVYRKLHVRFLIRLYDTLGTLLWKKQPPQSFIQPEHICCIILHQIGDVVMTIPTITAIRTLLPHTKLSIITGSSTTAVLKNNPWQADTYTFDATWNRVVTQLKETPDATSTSPEIKFSQLLDKLKPDMALVFFPDLKVNRILSKTKIPYTIGFANAGGGFGLTHALDMPQKGHQVERNFVFAQTLAALLRVAVPPLTPPSLLITESDKARALAWLKAHDITPSKTIVLHPFGSAVPKNWRPDYWAEVIDWLTQRKYQCVIIGGPKDQLTSDDPTIRQRISHATIAAGELPLNVTMALISQARLFIGVDSGPGHLAAACRTPMISIFSSVNDPHRYAPYGKDVTTLHKQVPDRRRWPYELPALPSGIIGNPYSDGITPRTVIAALEKTLSSPTTPK